MKNILINGKAILEFLKTSASCCIMMLAGLEPTENKKKLFEITAKNPNKNFTLSELMEQLPLRNESVFDKDMERITGSKPQTDITSKNILERCDILNYFAQEHITFINSRAKEEKVSLKEELLLCHTLCLCIITKKTQETFNARFINSGHKEKPSRKVIGLVNLSGNTVKQNDIVLVHFAAIIASAEVCGFSNTKRLTQIQNNLSQGKIIKALKGNVPINYRHFAGQDITKKTQERAKEITGNPNFITP